LTRESIARVPPPQLSAYRSIDRSLLWWIIPGPSSMNAIDVTVFFRWYGLRSLSGSTSNTT
jgi:hypothetical protein